MAKRYDPRGYQCLTCGRRVAEINARRRCDQGHGRTHEWAERNPPSELQARADVVGLQVVCPECREPAGAPCRSRGPRKELERTHILRRCAVQAELGLIGPDGQVA